VERGEGDDLVRVVHTFSVAALSRVVPVRHWFCFHTVQCRSLAGCPTLARRHHGEPAHLSCGPSSAPSSHAPYHGVARVCTHACRLSCMPLHALCPRRLLGVRRVRLSRPRRHGHELHDVPCYPRRARVGSRHADACCCRAVRVGGGMADGAVARRVRHPVEWIDGSVWRLCQSRREAVAASNRGAGGGDEPVGRVQTSSCRPAGPSDRLF